MKDHEYRKTVLESGLTVHTIRIPDSIKTYYEVLVRSGSAVESTKTGIAHYLEHMFGYGSAEYGKKDLLPYFSKLGGEYNFTTGPLFTNYYAYALPHKVSEYAERIASVLTGPIFTEEHVELERGPILSEELGKRDAVKINPFFPVAQRMYDNHRYSKPNIGLEEDIRTITYEDLRSYYDGVYVASNMHIICAGNINHEDAVKDAERQYATLSQRQIGMYMEPLEMRPGSHLGKMDIAAADVTIGFIVPYEGGRKDTTNRVVAQLLGMRLHDALRDEHNLIYSIGAHMDATSHEQGLTIKTSVEPTKLKQVLDKIFETITKAARDLNQEDLIAYKAGYEEYLADMHSHPRANADNVTYRIVHNLDFIAPGQDLAVVDTLTDADLRGGLASLLSGKPFMAVAGPLEQIPQLEIYVNKARRDLGIDGIGAGSNIKEEFNPRDP